MKRSQDDCTPTARRHAIAGRLDGRAALVFGASGKVGRTVALLFAQEGARVALQTRHAPRVAATAAAISAAGGAATILEADPLDRDALAAALASARGALGGRYALVYAASAYLSGDLRTGALTAEEWDLMLDTNLRGAFLACQQVIPAMATGGGGSVVLIGATSRDRLLGNTAYAAAKAGLIGLTQRLAREYRADNVRVNAVLPRRAMKVTATDRVDPVPGGVTAEGQAEDIAYGCLYLASDEARFVTGTTLTIDGGLDL